MESASGDRDGYDSPMTCIERCTSTLVLGAILTAGAACGSTGDGGGNTLDGGPNCTEKATVLASASETSVLGLSGEDVVAVAAGDHDVPIVWNAGIEDAIATVKFGPESGEGQMSLSIAYEGGEVRFVESTFEDDHGYDDGGGDFGCEDRLEVDVQVSLATAGGALNESFVAPLSASRADFATLGHTLKLDELMGTLSITELDPPDAIIVDPRFEATFHPFGLEGSLSSGIEVHIQDSVGFGPFSFFTFPGGPDPCEGEGVAAPPDGALQGFSADDVMAVLNGVEGTSITWTGGEPSDLALAFSAPEVACFTVDSYSYGLLGFDVVPTVQAADGSVDGQIPVHVSASPGQDGALAAIELSIYAYLANTLPVDAFVQTYGIDQFDLSPYDEAALEFSGVVVDPQAGSTITGSLAVHGVTLHNCSDEPGAPCEGNQYTELGRATWGN